jgi:hypothetical protein
MYPPKSSALKSVYVRRLVCHDRKRRNGSWMGTAHSDERDNDSTVVVLEGLCRFFSADGKVLIALAPPRGAVGDLRM